MLARHFGAMQKRVISSKMPIQTVQKGLATSCACHNEVNGTASDSSCPKVDAPIPRVFIPHRLPAGPVLDSIAEVVYILVRRTGRAANVWELGDGDSRCETHGAQGAPRGSAGR